MVLKINKPAVNVREELAYLRKPTGIAGQAMLAADTIIQQAALLGVAPNNIIKNGAMAVAQRGSVSHISAGAGQVIYGGPDRFAIQTETTQTLLDFTIRQTADGPDSFTNCFEIEIDTIEAVAAADDLLRLKQMIEGLDLQGLGWGTSAGKPLTLQFWVKSNIPGTYSLYAYMPEGGGDLVNFTYTINQSAVWQKVVWVIPPNTAAAPANDNTSSLEIGWTLAAGSTFTGGGSQPNWGTFAGNKLANGQLADLGAVDASYFRMTGVQATIGAFPEGVPFQHRSYGEELAACQRYYFQKVSGTSQPLGIATYKLSSQVRLNIDFPVAMRAAPSVITSNGTNHFRAENSVDDLFNGAWVLLQASTSSALIYSNAYVSGTQNTATAVSSNSSGARLAFNSEL